MAGFIKKLKKAKIGRKATNTVNKVKTVVNKVDKVLKNPVVNSAIMSNPLTASVYTGVGSQIRNIKGGIQKAKPLINQARTAYATFV